MTQQRKGKAVSYDAGLHGESSQGSVDVGLSVDPQPGDALAVGLSVDAPQVGRLVLGFSIEADGKAAIAALQRTDGSGRTVKGAVADAIPEAKVAALEQQLAKERARAAKAEKALVDEQGARLDADLPGLSSKLSALETRAAELEAELLAARNGKALQEQRAAGLEEGASQTGAELERAKADLEQTRTQRDAAREEVEKQRSEHRAALAKLEEDATSRQRAQEDERTELQAAVAKLEADLKGVREQLEAEQTRAAKAEDWAAAQKTAAESLKASLETSDGERADLRKSLDEERATAGRVTSERDEARTKLAEVEQALLEEQHRRDELLADISFIQGQVSDLASTKGSLLSRLDMMSKRETKRTATTSEMNSLLRDREAVAADRTVSLRRVQARAEQLETTLSETKTQADALKAELESEKGAKERAAALQVERDELKVQIAYFQKQMGALQRTLKDKDKALESAGRSPMGRSPLSPTPVPAVSRGHQPTRPALPAMREPGAFASMEPEALAEALPLPPAPTGSGVKASLDRASSPSPSVSLPDEWANELDAEPELPSESPVASPRPKR